MASRPISDVDDMPRSVNRRGFLRNVAWSSAGVAGALAVGTTASKALGIEPIKRIGTSKFKFSLAAYSYRDLLTGKSGKPAQLMLEDFITDCAKMGLEGTELTGYYFPPQPTPEYLRKIKEITFRLGLDISGTAIRNDFCYPSGPDRDREIQHVKRWVDYADTMGAPVIRIFSGMPRGTSEAEAHRLAVAGFEETCDYAGQRGIFLALENHGGLSTKVDDMLSLIRDVKSPWFSVNLDTGNFHTDDPYADLAKIAPYATNVQVKVVIPDASGKNKRPSDYRRLAKILSDAGYRGYIVLEYEEAEDPRVACPKHMDQIRAAFLGHSQA